LLRSERLMAAYAIGPEFGNHQTSTPAGEADQRTRDFLKVRGGLR